MRGGRTLTGDSAVLGLLALVFAVAGVLKLLPQSGVTLVGRLHPALAVSVAVLELAIAFLLLVPSTRKAAASAGSLLVVGGTVFVAWRAGEGDTAPCGCLGPALLGPVEHVVLAVCMFTLCVQTLMRRSK